MLHNNIISMENRMPRNLKTAYIIRGRESTGLDIFHVLLVDKVKLPILQKELKKHGTIKVTDYGQVIASGFGKEIPEETKQYVLENYGVEIEE